MSICPNAASPLVPVVRAVTRPARLATAARAVAPGAVPAPASLGAAVLFAVLLAAPVATPQAATPNRGMTTHDAPAGPAAPAGAPLLAPDAASETVPATGDARRLASGTFDKLHEPSGVTRLDDGTLIVVEDEPRRPMRRVRIDIDADAAAVRVIEEKRLKPAKGLPPSMDVGELDDLEGIARDGSGRVFAIGSHDDAEERRASARQKLVGFSIRDGRMVDIAMTRDLRRDLLAAYPAIAEEIASGDKAHDALNIEALAFDRRRAQLLIGLRSPRLDKDAVIVRLTNPDAYLDGTAPPAFARTPWTLDLDKGGLRALSYDDRTDRLLVISRRESGKGGSFKLWHVAADGSAPAVRIRLPDVDDPFDDVEGLVPLDNAIGADANIAAVLFVRDDGSRRERAGGGWFTVSRERLGID